MLLFHSWRDNLLAPFTNILFFRILKIFNRMTLFAYHKIYLPPHYICVNENILYFWNEFPISSSSLLSHPSLWAMKDTPRGDFFLFVIKFNFLKRQIFINKKKLIFIHECLLGWLFVRQTTKELLSIISQALWKCHWYLI